MKKVIAILSCLLISLASYSQVNNHFNFQGLLLDEFGDELRNKTVEIIIQITEDEQGENVVYGENHTIRTNNSGVFDIAIGTGDAMDSSFDQIDWLSYVPYIQMEYQVSGSNTWKKMNASKFHSVPFCLYAQKIVCQEGVPNIGKIGLPGPEGPAGPVPGIGPQGPQGPPGAIGCLRITNIIPTENIRNGEVYLDDGTNRTDGSPGYRYYDEPNGTWVDL